ncbi:DUF4230 domain-containing protein [Sporosarcina pasteurii]|uniref:DUF4230 domain-containing protein n=1 Tax=Sporosarcina pasteurii TaxID=1474 RepID=A0A380BD84_SPOPA|nr:DUF4230 domain-containing protein [Sporosarcina pasteurii]MDS9472337.1 DUF4230 domain-containing protein [Sporosarcina pasteurii]QBQ06316.1 DUF4230 domain-containing protein [Sporosarcina pasteurii]SUI98963.1 Uncharacterised protein [Sporosarcina pasteurii]
MRDKEKIDEIERLLKELKASEEETAVTVEETKERPKRPSNFWRVGKLFLSSWKKSALLVAVLVLLMVITLPIAAFYFIKNGSTFTEEKGAFLERVQNLNELATAEAYTKVIIERQDNAVFGQSIGLNLPGTKRQLLVVIPGSVKAGVHLGQLSKKDIVIDEKEKTATLTLPRAKFLGGAEIYFDEVEVFSYEGLFREKANIKEAYELAEEAKRLIIEETTGQGVLQMAERNAEKTLKEMFSLAGYDVTIQFKE